MSLTMSDGKAEIYGIKSFNHHGWSKLVTIMGPAGNDAVRVAVAVHEAALVHIKVVVLASGLTQYHGIREGALERLIEAAGIIMLTPEQWAARKAELK